MNTDRQGTSTCKPGEEQYEEFYMASKNGRKMIQYDYRAKSGELFSTVVKTLEIAREQRDRWLSRLNAERNTANPDLREINTPAPTPLSVLESMMEFWDNGTPVRPGAEVVAEARAAIAQARGSAPVSAPTSTPAQSPDLLHAAKVALRQMETTISTIREHELHAATEDHNPEGCAICLLRAAIASAQQERDSAAELLDALAFLLAEFNQHVPEDCNCPKVRAAADKARVAIERAKGA